MLKVEIIQSSDPLAIGVYNYQFDQIFIGRSKKNDLVFLEQDFPAKFITITVTETSLIGQNHPEGPSFFINGKKTNGIAKLKTNDIVRFGSHQLKILDFKKTVDPIDLSPFYEKVSEASMEVREALTILEGQLIKYEKDGNV